MRERAKADDIQLSDSATTPYSVCKYFNVKKSQREQRASMTFPRERRNEKHKRFRVGFNDHLCYYFLAIPEAI